MCSITPPTRGPVSAAQFVDAVAHASELGDVVAGALGDRGRFDLGGLHPDQVAALTTELLALSDRAAAAATVLAGQVAATTGPGTGALIAGRFGSARRWLEVDAGLAPASAKAVLARARDLREHSDPVRDAWLAGDVHGDAVRELTSGVTSMLRPVPAPRAEKERLRAEALDLLLPVARIGTPADVTRALNRMRFIADPDGASQAAMDAFDDQSLTCVQVGSMSKLTAWLTHENAAAAMTVIDQYARGISDRDPDVAHDPTCPLVAPAPDPGSTGARWCSCGASAAAGVTSKDRWPHLLAVAFGEVVTGLLDESRVGSHHGVAPHVTVQVDAAALAAGIGGSLTMPGTDDPVLLPPETVRRILCDANVTPVVLRRLTIVDPATCAHDLVQLLADAAVEVLYVGRAERTVSPRLRRALETRDGHCVFPGCRAHVRRCHAHHIHEWEYGGTTDISNLALLCVLHHHAVHEGGWTITPVDGAGTHETGYWTFTPPERRRRP
jgi:hypothetical protein